MRDGGFEFKIDEFSRKSTNPGIKPPLEPLTDEVNSDFKELVDAHYAALYRFALNLSKNESDAADLTQQAFYSLAAKGHQLRDGSKVKSWLFTTLYRDFIGSRRHSARFPHEPIETGDKEPPCDPVSIANQIDSRAALETLGKIEEDYRAPLTLFYLEEFSYKEIAEVLNLPMGTVMSRLSRGKEILRELLLRTRQPGPRKIIPIAPSLLGGEAQ